MKQPEEDSARPAQMKAPPQGESDAPGIEQPQDDSAADMEPTPWATVQLLRFDGSALPVPYLAQFVNINVHCMKKKEKTMLIWNLPDTVLNLCVMVT